MRTYISSIITLIASLAGLIGGFFWGKSQNWDWEPVILMTVSLIHILGFIISGFFNTQEENTQTVPKQQINNSGKVKKQINIVKNKGKIKM
jgi:hypothetical protein